MPLGSFDPPSRTAGVDARLDAVVLRSLAKEPDQRYQKASQIKTDVEAITSQPHVPDAQPPIPAATRKIRDRVYTASVLLMIEGFVVLGYGMSGLTYEVVTTIQRWVSGPSPYLPSPGESLVLCSLGAVGSLLGFLVLRGGWHMLRLEGYRPALLAGFLGQPVGIYALTRLSEPEVKDAFAETGRWLPLPRFLRSRSEPTRTPRFSRKAIVGAAWAVLFFLCLVAFAVVPLVGSTTIGLVLLAVAAAELLAPFGTTILGLVAISDIRHSRGRLTGLGLAPFPRG